MAPASGRAALTWVGGLEVEDPGCCPHRAGASESMRRLAGKRAMIVWYRGGARVWGGHWSVTPSLQPEQLPPQRRQLSRRTFFFSHSLRSPGEGEPLRAAAPRT